MVNGVKELDVKHVLIFAIVAFMLYHLTSGCRCFNNGFSVGGEGANSTPAPSSNPTYKWYGTAFLCGAGNDSCQDYIIDPDKGAEYGIVGIATSKDNALEGGSEAYEKGTVPWGISKYAPGYAYTKDYDMKAAANSFGDSCLSGHKLLCKKFNGCHCKEFAIHRPDQPDPKDYTCTTLMKKDSTGVRPDMYLPKESCSKESTKALCEAVHVDGAEDPQLCKWYD